MKGTCEICRGKEYRHGLCARCYRSGVRRPQVEREERLRAAYARAILAYAEVDAEDPVAFARAWARVRVSGRRFHSAPKLNDPRRRSRLNSAGNR